MNKKRATIHDIAKELNTTASTVSRALQDHPRISKMMKQNVQDVAQKLDYQPNAIASSLRKGKGNTIGVIVPQIDRQFFSSLIRGLEDIAYEAGFNVLICQSYNSWDRERLIVENLISGRVDGLMVSLATGTKDYRHFEMAQKKGLPLLFFDRVPENMEANRVEADDFTGSLNATEHLIAQGCKRIVHFSGPKHVSVYKNRFEGYLAALARHNIIQDPELIFRDTLTQGAGEQAGMLISKMNPMPDGIFSASDFSALGAMIRLKDLNIRIPEEIAIIGFANEPFDSIVKPQLSSVDQHSIEIGRNVAQLFLEGIRNPEAYSKPHRIILNTELHIRESSLRRL